ncbi:MAG TPA: cyclic peptide export ABC transporter, partial [Gemmataceae bacterium]|nr:cyclic peptide export ABC transporter [Gemmataceae bacterium]
TAAPTLTATPAIRDRGCRKGRNNRFSVHPRKPALSRCAENPGFAMNLLRLLLRTSGRSVALAVAVGLAGGLASAGLIALIQQALAGGATRPLFAAFAGLCGVVLVTKIASQALLVRLGHQAVHDLYLHLSRQVLAVPLRALEEFGPHRVLALLTEDVPVIANALLGVSILGINIAILLCCLAYLAWLSPTVFLCLLLFLVGGTITYLGAVRWANHYLKRAREGQDELLHHFRGLTEGAKELKIHRPRRLGFLDQLLRPTCDGLRNDLNTGMIVYAAAASWGQLLFFVAIGVVLFALPSWVTLDVGTLAGAVLTTLYTASPLEAILGWLPGIGQARVSLRKVEDLSQLGGEPEVADTSAVISEPKPRAVVELVGVTHTYHRENEDGGFLLGPIDLTLQPGEVVFLISGNGSGKTTLAKVLAGLYAPESGEIRLNGKPVTAADREAYRQHFSAVFADFYLFERLIGLGTTGATAETLDHQAAQYLDLLRLDQKVSVRDGVFSTTELSHGQRKRLALLTAYLEDRPVYLFDEWAADQDPVFKKVFYTQLLPELRSRGKAVLVISHDERYFGKADRIVRLDYGKLIGDEVTGSFGGEKAPARALRLATSPPHHPTT